FTNYRVQIQQALAQQNNSIALQGSVWGYFDALDTDTTNIVSASQKAYTAFDCDASSAVWHPFEVSICSSTGVAGAIALSTCICFLFAICLIPGVCIGIVGYKRFDPHYFGVKHLIPPD